jgi:hypothetical protein
MSIPEQTKILINVAAGCGVFIIILGILIVVFTYLTRKNLKDVKE